jgi:hypothetical protein
MSTTATYTFAAAWELARAQLPYLYAFCGGVVWVTATTSSVESDFSRLRFAKSDYRSNITCFNMEGSVQASDLISIARKIAVPTDFPCLLVIERKTRVSHFADRALVYSICNRARL